jgi:hypothetical protein
MGMSGVFLGSPCGKQSLLHLVDVPLFPLRHADNAQQAFSSDEGPLLHLVIPALEALHQAWSTRIERPKYFDFRDALNAGTQKINKYYLCTAESDAYTFAMCKFSVINCDLRLSDEQF